MGRQSLILYRKSIGNYVNMQLRQYANMSLDLDICGKRMQLMAMGLIMMSIHGWIWPLHYGQKQPRIQTVVLGHSLVHSLVCNIRSLAPDCSLYSRPPLRSLVPSLAHSFARSLTLLTPLLMGQWMIRWLFCLCFFLFSTIVFSYQ